MDGTDSPRGGGDLSRPKSIPRRSNGKSHHHAIHLYLATLGGRILEGIAVNAKDREFAKRLLSRATVTFLCLLGVGAMLFWAHVLNHFIVKYW